MHYYNFRTLEVLQKKDSEHLITGKTIADMLGLKERFSGREGADVRAIIHSLRIKGYPIIATDRGYYYAHTKKELSDYISRLKNRIEEQQKIVDGLRKSFKNIGASIKDIETKEEEKEAKELAQQVLM